MCSPTDTAPRAGCHVLKWFKTSDNLGLGLSHHHSCGLGKEGLGVIGTFSEEVTFKLA